MVATNNNEDDAVVGAAATSVLASGIVFIIAYENRSSIPREPYTTKDQEREFYMNSILNGSDVHCIGQIRMSKHVFYELCNALRSTGLLRSTKNMSVQEQVLIFLEIVGFNERFRKIGSHFYRSIDSIHRCFHTVLQAVLKLYPILIKSPDGIVQPEIRSNYRYYPWFSDCIGAMDGTHVLASVPIEQQNRFRGRKGTTTQNVLAAINFNLKFTYVLAGWEGSAHDSRILNDALERPQGFQIPQDKYYLVDAGYGLRKGFIPPYHGVRYHLQEYSDRPPQNEKELFNLRHASLRSSVERAFAILKRRFRVVDKKIDMFEEMSLVCGNDRARGDCAKSFDDISLDCSSEKGNDNNIEGLSKENDVVGETSQVKTSRKRSRSSDVQDVVGDISTKLGEVAAAISKMADSRLDVTKLYEEIMAIKGYEEEFLGDAFDFLVKNDTLAKAFMVKSQNLRKVWLERFKRQQ